MASDIVMTADRKFKASFKYRSLLFDDKGEFSWTITALDRKEAFSAAKWEMFEWTLPDWKQGETKPPMKTWGLKLVEIK